MFSDDEKAMLLGAGTVVAMVVAIAIIFFVVDAVSSLVFRWQGRIGVDKPKPLGPVRLARVIRSRMDIWHEENQVDRPRSTRVDPF